MEVEESGSEEKHITPFFFSPLFPITHQYKNQRYMKESSNTTQCVEHRGLQTSDGISGGAGVPPQVPPFHLMDVEPGPMYLLVIERPDKICLREGVSRAAESDTILKFCSYRFLTDVWSVWSIWNE